MNYLAPLKWVPHSVPPLFHRNYRSSENGERDPKVPLLNVGPITFPVAPLQSGLSSPDGVKVAQ